MKDDDAEAGERLVSISELTTRLSCGRSFVYKLNRTGRLILVKQGRCTFALESDVRKYIAGLKDHACVRKAAA